MKASLCVLLQLFELDPDLLRSKPEPQDQSLHARFGEIELRRRVDLAVFRVLDRAFGGFGSGSTNCCEAFGCRVLRGMWLQLRMVRLPRTEGYYMGTYIRVP